VRHGPARGRRGRPGALRRLLLRPRALRPDVTRQGVRAAGQGTGVRRRARSCHNAPMGSHANGAVIPSPYVELDRADWARLREEHPMHLDASDVERLRGLGEPLDMAEVEQVYLPISRLLSFYEEATARLHQVTGDFLLERRPDRTPFVIGVAGSVAAGKSTTARILAELIRRWDTWPEV